MTVLNLIEKIHLDVIDIDFTGVEPDLIEYTKYLILNYKN